MKSCAFLSQPIESPAQRKREVEQFYSVEFSVSDLELPYQFKIWNTASKPICVLVREDSDILPRLRVGKRLTMKFYTADAACPTECLETEIRDISKDDQGPFKGHYLVGLEILGNGMDLHPQTTL